MPIDFGLSINTKMQYPDFLIIGAARAGTSSLHKNLERHPQLMGPKRLGGNHKEAHFFDKTAKFNRGLSWYLRLWPHCQDCLKFESTPNYLYIKEVPGRIKKILPNWGKLKFIVMLRDPIKRAWSHYWHWRHKHQEPQKVLMDTKSIYIRKGIYIDQIKNWHQHFKKSRFMMIQSERFFDYPKGIILEVHHFLGIKPMSDFDPIYFDPKKTDKKTKYPYVPQDIMEFLSDFYKPYNERLREYLDMSLEGWL